MARVQYITNIFYVQTKQKIELSMYYSESYYQPIYHSIFDFPLGHLYNTTDYICFVLLSPIQLRIANKVETGSYEHIYYFIIDLFYYSILNFS